MTNTTMEPKTRIEKIMDRVDALRGAYDRNSGVAFAEPFAFAALPFKFRQHRKSLGHALDRAERLERAVVRRQYAVVEGALG